MAMISKLVNASIKYGVINDHEKELYQVGISSLFFSALTWSILLIVGIVFGFGYQCLIYLAFFIPLRCYAGGHHQDSRTKCFLTSILTFMVLFFGANEQMITFFVGVYLFALLPSLVIIWILSPIQNSQKPLCKQEINHHRIAARVIIVIDVTIVALLFQLHTYTYLYFALSAIILVAILLVAGAVKNRRRILDLQK